MTRQLTLEDCEHLFWLAAREYVFFSTYDPESKDWSASWNACVNVNDTFWYAADAEELPHEHAKTVRDLVERFGPAGYVAWVAIRRGQEPLDRARTPQYLAAKAFIEAQR